MRTAIEQQVLSTLGNLRREVNENGITEAASDMWAHALAMYRVKHTPFPVPIRGRVSVDMPNRHVVYDMPGRQE